jgi:hypothetical protein
MKNSLGPLMCATFIVSLLSQTTYSDIRPLIARLLKSN